MAQAQAPQPVKIFYAYAQTDEKALQNLRTALAPVEHSKQIQTWHRRQILPGTPITQEIEAHLDQSQIVIVLLSMEFLASDYCYGPEIAHALQLHQDGKIHIVPILLQDCLWQDTPLKELQPLPRDSPPISALSPRRQPGIWHTIAIEIQTLAKHFQEQAQQESTKPQTNGSKTRRKKREPAHAKSQAISSAAVPATASRPTRTTRSKPIVEEPETKLPEPEAISMDVPEPATEEAATTTPDFKQRSGSIQEQLMAISLQILFWESNHSLEGPLADERRKLCHILNADKHVCLLGRELDVPQGFSLQNREVEQAHKSDLTLMLVDAPAIGDMHEFCQHKKLLKPTTLILYPGIMKSVPGDWGLDKRLNTIHRILDYYEENDIISCKMREKVIDWVQGWRLERYNNQSRRG